MPTKKTTKPTTPTPFQDRVIISKKKPDTVSAGGIIIPAGVISEENKGVVVAVGPLVGRTLSSSIMIVGEENKDIPKVGDIVLFGEYAGMEVEFEGQKFLVVKEADVLCKI